MSARINIASESLFEETVGYSRAVRVGSMVTVSGTVGNGDNIATQTRNALRRIETALVEAGASLADVIRTRMYVTDIGLWKEVGAVHAEFFGGIRPASTMVEVSALIEPRFQIEIEAEAYLDDHRNGAA